MIDINCDLAEGEIYDERLMPLISSCNIACGGHFGDANTVEVAIQLAIKKQVKIGAHPSYPDQESFGRKIIELDLIDLRKSLKSQILLVKEITERLGGRLHHVKPHGALYNELKYHTEKSKMLVELVKEIDENLILFVSPKSVVKNLAETQLKIAIEGFADRAYESDFSLVPRGENEAVLQDKHSILERVKMMVNKGEIISKEGDILHQKFDTICVHSDTQNSLEILEYLKQNLNY
ncbi:5-oxoprolinase subunit PxpA [Mesonia ostreae]|uniref:5-oxoprolinase subunit PxpA n=1 Tax=Mesonia ostreae TaxID=861110 RepID=A0ABU2KGG7_9FLAO|nr:5-oxoprolinase subunit PxpA [Mesonia ostreae]MDT0293807.1 5-oxoprolinase subunit PxpA [Mesonia ostreae]